jgi:hypothetical protein
MGLVAVLQGPAPTAADIDEALRHHAASYEEGRLDRATYLRIIDKRLDELLERTA